MTQLKNSSAADNGNNLLNGTAVKDKIKGLHGNDTITGLSGNDTLIGNAGDDSLDGGVDDDKLLGNAGADTLRGGSGNDNLNGGGGNDILFGDNGNDTLNGGTGADNMIGGDGDDLYLVDNIRDTITENATTLAGIDSVQSSISYTLPDNVENLTLTGLRNLNAIGSDGANTLVGNKGDNFLNGMNGKDVLQGGIGDDTLSGGGGADTLIGGDGSDTYQISSDEDIIVETEHDGDQDVVESSIHYVLGNHLEVLILKESAVSGTGNKLDNIIEGNDIGNTLEGDSGNDDIRGNGGDDTISGGVDNDTINGGDGNDQAVYKGKIGDYKITFDADSNTWTVKDTNGNDGNEGIDSITNIETLLFADGEKSTNTTVTVDEPMKLIGTVASESLPGGTGNDTLSGAGGDDTLTGNRGADILTGGAGNDRFVFTAGDSGVDAGNRDVITDFEQGMDLIDLSSFSELKFIDDLDFSGSNQVSYGFDPAVENTMIQLNLDNEIAVDFEILLMGLFPLSSEDFLFD